MWLAFGPCPIYLHLELNRGGQTGHSTSRAAWFIQALSQNLHEAAATVLCPDPRMPALESHGAVRGSPEEDHKDIRGLELLPCEERHMELNSFSPEKRKLWGNLIVAFQ